MKKTLFTRLLIAAAAFLTVGQTTQVFAADAARATVAFDHPEKFTDINDSVVGTDKGRDYNLKLIRERVEEVAAKQLPAGQKLEINFTDIDLAGDYLPAMATGRDFRVMKDTYAPRMKFTYKITDGAGAVVKEGVANLSDMNYLSSVSTVGRGDPLFYDLSMLSDWLRSNLK